MSQENECASIERHEGDIRDLRKAQEEIKLDIRGGQRDHAALEKLVIGIAKKVDDFVTFCQDREEKRELREEAKDKAIIERFEKIEGKVMGSSMVFKIANNAITMIVTGIIMLLVVRALPELSNFLH